MKRLFRIAAFASLSGIECIASGQTIAGSGAPAAPPVPGAPAAAAPALGSAAPPAAPGYAVPPAPGYTAPPPPMPVSNQAACVVGDHPLDWSDSARTATGLVCDALRQRGVDIGLPSTDAHGATSEYVVSLDQLGATFFLGVTFESPIGEIVKTRRASLDNLSEAQLAAPRLAAAMLDNGSAPDSAAPGDTIVPESRGYRKTTDGFFVGIGLSALSMPAQGAYMGPAGTLFAYYETGSWAFGLQLIEGDADMHPSAFAVLDDFSVGARYFFSDGEVSPFFGGGLALSYINEHEHDGTYQYLTGGGTGAFAEVGIEALRLHRTHLIASLRVDAPFYALERTADTSYNYDSALQTDVTQPPSGPITRYEVPMTFTLGIGF